MVKNKTSPIFTLLPPYYDQPSKDLKLYLNLIEEEFSIKINKHYYDHYAFGNDVFIINDQYIFRFPRTELTRQHLKYEIDLLNYLKSIVTIQIPYYTFIANNKEFAGYNIIPGKLLSPALFKTLNRKNKEKVVDELINFVNTFHSIRKDEFVKFKPGKREDFIPIEERIEADLEKKLFPKLSKEDVNTITDFYKEAKKYIQDVQNTCPTHGDLYAYNVIWNRETEGIGIIDFSDYLITDPARDFEVFYDFGSEYAELAYSKYKGSKDKDFLQRAEIYWKLHGIYTLLSSLLGAHITFDYAYKYYFKKKFNLP